jgi:hypothetical protein
MHAMFLLIHVYFETRFIELVEVHDRDSKFRVWVRACYSEAEKTKHMLATFHERLPRRPLEACRKNANGTKSCHGSVRIKRGE